MAAARADEDAAAHELRTLLPPSLLDKDVLEITLPVGGAVPLFLSATVQQQQQQQQQARSVTVLELTDAICRDAPPAFLAAPLKHVRSEQFDVVVFSRVLFLLSDVQVKTVAKRVLQWLRPDGVVVFRESCFSEPFPFPVPTGSTTAASTQPPPTPRYRHPSFYVGSFGTAFVEGEARGFSYLDFALCKSLDVYRRQRCGGTHGELCFVYRKVAQPSDDEATNARGRSASEQMDSFQNFLDNEQYSRASIARYEQIFGAGYVSTGGQATTTEFVAKLDLQHGERVLDVGCGIGGGAFYMANTFGVAVVGIDLSTNMVFRAMEAFSQCFEPYPTAPGAPPPSASECGPDVAFEICDATTKDFAPESFDVVYSRDTLLHIEHKDALFAQFLRWLKPGGKLLISDYCCRGDGAPSSQQFAAYVHQRGYSLLSPSAYGELLARTGFVHVVVEDRTEHFERVLRDELERVTRARDAFVRETSEADYAAIVQGWEAKLQRCAEGDQKWGLFFARKPW